VHSESCKGIAPASSGSQNLIDSPSSERIDGALRRLEELRLLGHETPSGTRLGYEFKDSIDARNRCDIAANTVGLG